MPKISEYKKKIVNLFLDNGILVSPDLLSEIKETENFSQINDLIKKHTSGDEFLLLNKEISSLIEKKLDDVNWIDFEKSKVLDEKSKNTKAYSQFVDIISSSKGLDDKKKDELSADKKHEGIKVLSSYDKIQSKKAVKNFSDHFLMRYKVMERMLSQRQEMSNLISISRINQKSDRENLSIIGLVAEKQWTKNGNIMITVEDNTGTIKILVSKNKPDLMEIAQTIVHDEVIGVNGVNGNKIIYVNNMIFPDIPLNKELKKAQEETYAVFLSDLHVGSKEFLKSEFLRFISWLKGDLGNSAQKSVASKIKYIFIIGDLVDGVGIYPGQEDDLYIKDIYEQYEECARCLDMIPKNIQIIICPGNHDAMRIAEPQPALYKDYAKAIWNLQNVVMVSNPSVVNIHASEDFPGFDVLLYHGYSFDYYVQEVDTIRNNGGYDRADLLMKFLLQKRHLAPSHKSTLYIPGDKEDALFIRNIPDFFATGHIHKCSVASYRNVTTICGSCWQAKTAFQEKVGHNPEPCKVPVVNLQTRNVKILKFS